MVTLKIVCTTYNISSDSRTYNIFSENKTVISGLSLVRKMPDKTSKTHITKKRCKVPVD
jgi:hypothetical protein